MKTRNYFLASLLILAVSSCQSLFDEDSSRVVKFSVSVKNDRTKVHYSGDVDESGFERIEWDNDQVDIFMFWDGFGYEGNESRRYIVSHKEQQNHDDHIDRGTLSIPTDAKPLYWKGDATQGDAIKHYFYGVYPAGAGNVSRDETDGTISVNFALPSNADDMNYAYMAAGGQKDPIVTTESYDKAVDLDFYPMVTTLYVTLKNGAQKSGPIELRIAPSSKNTSNPLYGSYSADYNESVKRFVTKDTAEESVGENQVSSTSVNVGINGTVSIPFFIRPRAYEANDITLTVGDKSSDLPVGFNPCHKYNITVNLEKGDTPPTIEDLSAGGVLMLIQYLVYLNDNNKDLLRSFFNAVDVSDSVFQDMFINNIFGTLRNKLDGTFTIEQVRALVKEKDPNNTCKVMEALQYLANNVTELTVGGNGGVKKDITAKDFQVFNKLKVLTLLLNGDVDFTISKHPTLEEFKIHPNGSNGKLSLTIEDCSELHTVDISALNQNDAHSLTVLRCTKLKTVKVNTNNTKQSVTIKDCNAAVNTP